MNCILDNIRTLVLIRTGLTLGRIGRLCGGTLILGCRQIDRILSRLFSLQRSGLCQTAGNEVELGTVDEVLEVRTRSEQDVHRLDVLRRELVDALCSLGADRDAKRAQFSHLDLHSIEQLLHKTLAHVTDDTLHHSAAIDPVMVGDVLGELIERPDFRHLVLGIRLLGLLRLQRIAHHVNTVINHTIQSFKNETIKYINLNARLNLSKNAFRTTWEPVPLCF